MLREPNRVAATTYDLIVVGGGIYGAMLALHAARCGLRVCLMEARDFGGGTTWNSLRIVHGGLRYLQSLDLRRFFESVAARRWFARTFPRLVRPVPCLMPLYGQGLKRRSVMRAALTINDVLGFWRNTDLPEPLRIPAGRTLDHAATLERFPLARSRNLEGAAEWTDYFMISSERVLIETLRWACRLGADALNYTRVLDVVVEDNRVVGVRARDALSGHSYEVLTRNVVNCAGPEVRALARGRAPNVDELFRPSIAFNVLLAARLPTDRAVAVSAPSPQAQVLFLVPQEGTILAGTRHLARPADVVEAELTDEEIERFLADIRAAVPGLKVGLQQVCRVFAGLLPARSQGTADLATRELVLDHAAVGGPTGLVSVSGIKFTTAPNLASVVLHTLGYRAALREVTPDGPRLASATGILTDARQLWASPDDTVRDALLRTLREESVQTPEDFVLRRTNWGTTEVDLSPCYQRIASLIDATVWGKSGLSSG